MPRSILPRVRRSIRVFAGIGLVMTAAIQLDWTPSTPWMPAVNVLRVASAWGPTEYLVWKGVQAVCDLRYEVNGRDFY